MSRARFSKNTGLFNYVQGLSAPLIFNQITSSSNGNGGVVFTIQGSRVITSQYTSINDEVDSIRSDGTLLTYLGFTSLNNSDCQYDFLNTNNTVVNTLAFNMPNDAFYTVNATNNNFYDSAQFVGAGIYMNGNSGGNHFRGALIANACFLSAGSISLGGNEVDSSCHYGLGLANTATPGIAAAGMLTGKVTSDASNTQGTTGTSTFAGITDWVNFESPYRGWGYESASAFPNTNQTSTCYSGSTCRIYDARPLVTDATIRNVFGIYVPSTACPASADASNASNVITDQAGNVFLKNAVELVGDFVHNPTGNQNGLCESGESCAFMPNFGSYQGEGPLLDSCTFSGGNGVTGVKLYGYTTNGI